MSRTTSSTITPAVPVVPVTPIRAATPGKGKRIKQTADATPVAVAPVKPPPETPTKATSKTGTVKTPIAGGAASKSVPATPIQSKQQEKVEDKKPVTETPLKESVKGKGAKKTVAAAESTPQKKVAKATKAESKEPISASAATPVTSTKRQPPGRLDITAAIQAPTNEQSPATSWQKAETPAKNVRATPVASTTSVPASPAAAATGSPIKRMVAPRTLRVVPTPKTEVPPPMSTVSAPSLPQISTVDKLRSRQASIASVNLPGTPMSEMFSETASVTSTSISRASSPPPIGGKVGTAPVRKKTKSQAKKDRQERKKQIEEEMAIEENKSDVEVVQAPIIGRKKKEKKPTKSLKIPTKSQPASPKPATVEEEYSDAPVPVPAARTAQSAKTSATATPDPEQSTETKERREHTAQSIMADLQKTGELLASTLEFFKPLSSSLTHASRTTPATNMSGPPDLKIHFSEADLEAIAKKKAVRLNGHHDRPDSRTLITPNGKFFWGLSGELEEKALQLEKQIEELRGHARFHPRKQTGYSQNLSTDQAQTRDVLPAIATALKEAGKKLGNNSQQMPKLDTQSILNEAAREAARQAERLPITPIHAQQESQQPLPPQPQTPADAGTYLNQFVLPKTDNPPPNQPRPEMAAVGGSPGAGTANISVNVGKFAKAAKAVVEGGAVGSTEIDGMGMMAADLLGGVFVQGLEALVGAGLGFESSQEFGLDANGNITIGRSGGGVGGGLDMSGLMSAIEGFDGSRYGRGSVMSMEEAERAMHAARKEHEVLEKKLAGLMKKNKKLWGGVGGLK
jgi:CCR4-NOT transcription complex subunit 4